MPPSTQQPNGQSSSNAVAHSPEEHIKNRWELPFVYAFIIRFTTLKRMALFNTPMDLEDSVVFPGSTPVMQAIVEAFLLNLSPGCDCRPDRVERTLASVVERFCKGNERSIWWQAKEKKNVNPFTAPGVAFFTADWDLKLQALRQLVEWQICHTESIKSVIDEAWGVKHKITAKAKLEEIKQKEKKASAKAVKGKDAVASSEEAGPSKESLEMQPFGIDISKKRYWVVDDSPRIWSSGNPWKKNTWCIETLSSTRDELESMITSLKAARPPVEAKERWSRSQRDHDALVEKLEAHMPSVDTELARIDQAIKRVQAKELARVRAVELIQMRETRTRSKQRVDYAAIERGNAGSGEDGDGNSSDSSLSSLYDGDADQDEARPYGGTRAASSRASSSDETSLTSLSIASKRKRARNEPEWRGQRRSARLGHGPADVQPLECVDLDARIDPIVSSKKRRISSPIDDEDGRDNSRLGMDNGTKFSTQPRLSTETAQTSTDGDHRSPTAHSQLSDQQVPTRGGSIISDTSLSSLSSEDDL
ncbi:hypothetical protein FRB98_002495 [Tulasnella sp. 332]|nr:hypothetical protein FRB98_002495 [Tulasnella sp. 332]